MGFPWEATGKEGGKILPPSYPHSVEPGTLAGAQARSPEQQQGPGERNPPGPFLHAQVLGARGTLPSYSTTPSSRKQQVRWNFLAFLLAMTQETRVAYGWAGCLWLSLCFEGGSEVTPLPRHQQAW